MDKWNQWLNELRVDADKNRAVCHWLNFTHNDHECGEYKLTGNRVLGNFT